MTWLDDQFLVSGSRDGSLALWRITDDIVDQVLICVLFKLLYHFIRLEY